MTSASSGSGRSREGQLRLVSTPVPEPAAAGASTGVVQAASRARSALQVHLDRCGLAAGTVRAYNRQASAYATWLAAHADDHPDAFTDAVGAEGAVTAWRRHLLEDRAAPSSINQSLAAVTLLYELAGLRIRTARVRVPRPGEPEALTRAQEQALERAAARRGPRDAALIALLLHTGPRVAEVAGLDLADVAITARTGTVRYLGKGDQPRVVPVPAPARDRVRDWLEVRGHKEGPLWTGQRGRLSISGITQVVLAVGIDTAITELRALRPHRLRHTFATRLRQSGVDPAVIQSLLGHASLDTTGRYFRAGAAELAAVIERVYQP